MNSATLSHTSLSASRQGLSQAWSALWHASRVTAGVMLSARHHVEQVRAMRHLLRLSNECEAANPKRADALRQEAADLVD